MTPAEPSVEQLALDRLHAVARPRRTGLAPEAGPGVPSHDHPGRQTRRQGGPDVAAAGSATPVWPPPAGVQWLPVRPVDDDPAARYPGPGVADGPSRPAVGGGPRSAGGAWRPAGADPADAPADALAGADPATTAVGDVQAVILRSREDALAAAATGYAQAYGHPLDHPADHPAVHPAVHSAEQPAARRWWLSTRHAVVAGVAVVVLATGVAVRASTEVPGAPVPIASVGTSADPGAGVAPEGGGAEGAASAGGGVAAGSPGRPATARGALPAPGSGPAPAGAVAPAPAGSVVVHVVGQVPAPGVLTLAAGSRVADAIAAAGGAGPTADLAVVNLARVVVDGEQIHVPAQGEGVRAPPAPAVPGGAATSAGGAPAPVDLNTADLGALDALPGIGPVLAQRVLDWRTDNGPFRSVEELGEVSGIGDALLAALRPMVRV